LEVLIKKKKIEFSKCCTWSKLGNGSNLALGQAVRNILDHFVGTGLGRKRSGFRLARLFPKLLASCALRIQPELTPEISSGIPLVRLSSGGLEDASLDTIEGVGMTLSGSLGCPLLPETSGGLEEGQRGACSWGFSGFVFFQGWFQQLAGCWVYGWLAGKDGSPFLILGRSQVEVSDSIQA